MKILLLFLAAAVAFSQQVNLQTQVRGILRPANGGMGFAPSNTLPTLCTPGTTFFKLNAAAGSNWFGCTATNIWTVLGSSSAPGWSAVGSGINASTLLMGPGGSLSVAGGFITANSYSGILPGDNGGTGNGFLSFIGPATTPRTWTIPNASIDWSAITGVLKMAAGLPSPVTGAATDCVLVNGTSATCGSGGSATPPYTLCASGCDTTIPASGSTILASSHGQGANAVGFYFDSANVRVPISETRNSSGDLTIVYVGTLGRGIISGLAGGGGSGSGGAVNFITTTHSATPTYTVPSGANAATTFYQVLTGSVTSSTLAGGLTTGQEVCFRIAQDGTGGRTYAFPTNVLNFSTPRTDASAVTAQCGIYDGTNLQASSPAITTNLGGIGQGFLLTGGTAWPTPAANQFGFYAKTSDNSLHIVTSTSDFAISASGGSTAFSLDLPFGSCNNPGYNIFLWSIPQVANPATLGSCVGDATDLDQLFGQFGSTGAPALSHQFVFPSNWLSGSSTYLDIWVYQSAAAATGNIKFDAKIGCQSDGASAAGGFTYNANATTGTVVTPAINAWKKMAIGPIATSGSSTCAIGSRAAVRLARDNAVGSNFANPLKFASARLYQ